MSKEKEQIAFRVTPQMKRHIDLIMITDGSRTRNEFLEHAVQFYIDHLLAGSTTTLPVSVTSAIDGRLGMLEDRLSALLFNNSVELDMLVQIIARVQVQRHSSAQAPLGKREEREADKRPRVAGERGEGE